MHVRLAGAALAVAAAADAQTAGLPPEAGQKRDNQAADAIED